MDQRISVAYSSGIGVRVSNHPGEPSGALTTISSRLPHKQNQLYEKTMLWWGNLAHFAINSAWREHYHLEPISTDIRRIYSKWSNQTYPKDWWNLFFVHLPFLGNRWTRFRGIKREWHRNTSAMEMLTTNLRRQWRHNVCLTTANGGTARGYKSTSNTFLNITNTLVFSILRRNKYTMQCYLTENIILAFTLIFKLEFKEDMEDITIKLERYCLPHVNTISW